MNVIIRKLTLGKQGEWGIKESQDHDNSNRQTQVPHWSAAVKVGMLKQILAGATSGFRHQALAKINFCELPTIRQDTSRQEIWVWKI